MTTLMIQPTFQDVITDVREGLKEEDSFWINVIPISDLEDGKSREEIITVKKDGDALSFKSKSGDVEFSMISESEYQASLTDGAFRIITPKRGISTGIDNVKSFDISPGKDRFLVGDDDGTLTVGTLEDGTTELSIKDAHFSTITKSLFFPSGKVLLSAGLDLQIKLWDANDGSNPRTFVGHKERITDLVMIDRGRNFLSSGQDGQIKLWDCPTGSSISNMNRSNSLRGGITTLLLTTNVNRVDTNEVSSGRKSILAGHNSGVITKFDLSSEKEVGNFASQYAEVSSILETNSQEAQILAAYGNGTIALWDERNYSTPVKSETIGTGNILSVAKSVDDKGLLLALEGGIITEFDISEEGFGSTKSVVGGIADANENILSNAHDHSIFSIGSSGFIYEL